MSKEKKLAKKEAKLEKKKAKLAKKNEIKRVKGKEFFNYKRRHGDRRDGWRVRGKDPFFGVIPHIMPTRTGSMVGFEERIDTTNLDAFVRKMRRETDMKQLSRAMVIMAGLARIMARYPQINRFIRGRRIYARNYMSIAMVVKKEMTVGGDENVIKPMFNPDASLFDVYEAVHKEVEANKGDDIEANDTGAMARILNALPVWLLKVFVNFVTYCDDHNKLTKFVNEVSPFHTSMFITDIGSTGISAVYHHLYDFGTCSEFIAIGRREKYFADDGNGNPVRRSSITLRMMVDERIVDGYTYAKAMRYLVHLLENPEELLEKYTEWNEDPLC